MSAVVVTGNSFPWPWAGAKSRLPASLLQQPDRRIETMQALTREAMTGMATAALVAHYNAMTGKGIKKFSKREIGIEQILKIQTKQSDGNGGVLVSAPKAASAPAKRAKPKAKPRRIKGAVGSQKGRPVIDYRVTLTASGGKTKLHAESERTKLVEWLEKRGNKSALVTEIEKHFGRNMRGFIAKLKAAKWVKLSKDA